MELSLTRRTAGYLIILAITSSAVAWEPQEPEGARALSAEQIYYAFADRVAHGRDITFVHHHFNDGRYQGVSPAGQHYHGKWWTEVKDQYICYSYAGKMRDCYNIARSQDGNYYYYHWGSDRPDAFAELLPIPQPLGDCLVECGP